MPYVSLSQNAPDAPWEVRAYLDDRRIPHAHLTAMTATGSANVALIVSSAEASDLLEACRQAIEAMRDLDSHPALAERD